MKNSLSEIRTIQEAARQIKVIRDADVVVVGGGPAGYAAAVAAARDGADTVLVERYGHLGGMATGGLVMIFMPMSDGTPEQQIVGLCQETIDRLDARGAAIHPRKEDLGSNDKQLVSNWKRYAFGVVDGKVRMSVTVDPEELKCVINDMVEQAGVKTYLHSWAAGTVVEDNTIRGVIIESKSGRQAILGKVVIDATGDGDIFASAGASFEMQMDPQRRSSHLALTFRIGDVDPQKYYSFKEDQRERYTELLHELEGLGGFTQYIRTTRDDIIWVNNSIPGLNPLDVNDLSSLEVSGRKSMRLTLEFLQKHMPGFANSYILDSASQIGVRSSRRLIGEYIVTEKDLLSGTLFPDTIAICPDFRHTFSTEFPHWHVPYRALVPRDLDGLLVAGRCCSADLTANDWLAPVQICVAQGQAAGTAAALAVKNNVNVRMLSYKVLQNRLKRQGVPLPF